MYERMLNKQEEPTIAEMTAYCGACAELFTRLNEWLSGTFATTQTVTFPYGNGYGRLQTGTQEQIDHKYPCGDGGWLHYRVTCREQFEDIGILLTVKCI